MVLSAMATFLLFKDKLSPDHDTTTLLYLLGAIEGLAELTMSVMMLVKFGLI
jgi:hypothetical protein